MYVCGARRVRDARVTNGYHCFDKCNLIENNDKSFCNHKGLEFMCTCLAEATLATPRASFGKCTCTCSCPALRQVKSAFCCSIVCIHYVLQRMWWNIQEMYWIFSNRLLHHLFILSFVVFVDQRREVMWEWQGLLAAAVRLGIEPTHTAATCSTRGTIPPVIGGEVVVSWDVWK